MHLAIIRMINNPQPPAGVLHFAHTHLHLHVRASKDHIFSMLPSFLLCLQSIGGCCVLGYNESSTIVATTTNGAAGGNTDSACASLTQSLATSLAGQVTGARLTLAQGVCF
jgi:hypothetical protein